jgi:hypothetical protein
MLKRVGRYTKSYGTAPAKGWDDSPVQLTNVIGVQRCLLQLVYLLAGNRQQ